MQCELELKLFEDIVLEGAGELTLHASEDPPLLRIGVIEPPSKMEEFETLPIYGLLLLQETIPERRRAVYTLVYTWSGALPLAPQLSRRQNLLVSVAAAIGGMYMQPFADGDIRAALRHKLSFKTACVLKMYARWRGSAPISAAIHKRLRKRFGWRYSAHRV